MPYAVTQCWPFHLLPPPPPLASAPYVSFPDGGGRGVMLKKKKIRFPGTVASEFDTSPSNLMGGSFHLHLPLI